MCERVGDTVVVYIVSYIARRFLCSRRRVAHSDSNVSSSEKRDIVPRVSEGKRAADRAALFFQRTHKLMRCHILADTGTHKLEVVRS